jgi:VanZ like family
MSPTHSHDPAAQSGTGVPAESAGALPILAQPDVSPVSAEEPVASGPASPASQDLPVAKPAHRSSATVLAVLYAGLVIYASLYHTAQWRDQGLSPLAFLLAPWTPYWGVFDVVANLMGYMPLGFVAALAFMRGSRWNRPVLLATLCAATLSLLMEATQTYLPQRVPSLADWLLNTVGAGAGAATATALEKLGAIDRWSRFRARWFAPDARGALVLLVLWPLALLFPPAVPLGLGQVLERLEYALVEVLRDTPFLQWLPVRSIELQPLAPITELLCVALGLLVPCLLGYGVIPRRKRRAMFFIAACALSITASGLSAALSFAPEHAWSWLSEPAQVGWLAGALLAVLCMVLSPRVCLALLLLTLTWQMSLLNLAPASPYFTQTLQTWEQGRFIRFNGLVQWLGWLWPYAALVYAVHRLSRRDTPSMDAAMESSMFSTQGAPLTTMSGPPDAP